MTGSASPSRVGQAGGGRDKHRGTEEPSGHTAGRAGTPSRPAPGRYGPTRTGAGRPEHGGRSAPRGTAGGREASVLPAPGCDGIPAGPSPSASAWCRRAPGPAPAASPGRAPPPKAPPLPQGRPRPRRVAMGTAPRTRTTHRPPPLPPLSRCPAALTRGAARPPGIYPRGGGGAANQRPLTARAGPPIGGNSSLGPAPAVAASAGRAGAV